MLADPDFPHQRVLARVLVRGRPTRPAPHAQVLAERRIVVRDNPVNETTKTIFQNGRALFFGEPIYILSILESSSLVAGHRE